MADLRREFGLSSADEIFLDQLGLDWEATRSSSGLWLLIHHHALPPGYAPDHVTLAFQIPPGYPDVQLDMFWLHPIVSRLDGVTIAGAAHHEPLDGKQYQRWSRHRQSDNPWVPGQDSLETHYHLTVHALTHEFTVRPGGLPR